MGGGTPADGSDVVKLNGFDAVRGTEGEVNIQDLLYQICNSVSFLHNESLSNTNYTDTILNENFGNKKE